MKRTIWLAILLVIIGLGYLVYIKKSAVENRQVNSSPKTTPNTSPTPTNAQSGITILLPTSNQILNLGTTTKIRFSGYNAIDTKGLSISMTDQDEPGIEYYLTGSTQIINTGLDSTILEFIWDVGKYSHHSVDPISGTLSPGIYKLEITDGRLFSNTVAVMIK